MIKELASLKRLSPSNMEEKRFGTFTKRIIAWALTASGGDTIPPSKKPKAIEKPGRMALATRATAQAVMKTTGKAKLKIMRRHFHSSFHEAL